MPEMFRNARRYGLNVVVRKGGLPTVVRPVLPSAVPSIILPVSDAFSHASCCLVLGNSGEFVGKWSATASCGNSLIVADRGFPAHRTACSPTVAGRGAVYRLPWQSMANRPSEGETPVAPLRAVDQLLAAGLDEAHMRSGRPAEFEFARDHLPADRGFLALEFQPAGALSEILHSPGEHGGEAVVGAGMRCAVRGSDRAHELVQDVS